MREACLDENEIAELFDGAVEPSRRDRAEQHIDRCESCRELLAGLAALDDGPAPTPVEDASASGTLTGARSRETPAPLLAPGARVDHFEILSCLGGGGMGQIYAAHDTKLDRKVALKLVRRELLRSEEATARFQREARATARFNHPNIVTIHEVGEHDGQPYVALAYLDGVSLGQRLSEGELPVDEALATAEAIARALVEAHRHGVLHRDLKPANVHLGVDGRVRVLDFGLAKFLPWASDEAGEGRGAPDLSRLGEQPVFETLAEHIKGTPSHMAPEQWRGGEVGVAADVWALGVILYRMLGGRSPLEGATLRELAIEVPSTEPLRRLAASDTEAPATVVELANAFGIENLALRDRPSLPVGDRQIRVGVRAVSLNYRDLLMVRGHYNPKQPLPLVPCSDGVGVVEEVGAEVTSLAVGDRVAGLFAPKWQSGEPNEAVMRATRGGPLDGMLAEQVVMDEDAAIAVPLHLEDAEAATLPCAAVTAWRALVTLAGDRASDTVLVQGTGGVSSFALAFAKMHGAGVIATTSSPEKAQWLRAQGADEVIDYNADPKWGRAVRTLTDGRGVDIVVEVGGAGTLQQSLRAVRAGGTVAVIGVLAGGSAALSVLPVLMSQIRMQGVFVGSRADFAAMNQAISAHALRPVVDRVFGLDEAKAAFEHLASAKHRGKVCIRVGG